MATGYSTLTLPDGAKLAYEIKGSFHIGNKRPVVLICGMSALRGDWARLSHSLAQSYPVLLYDHRGMGDSHGGDDEFTIEVLARDLLFLLSFLGWKEISLCGYSMGGVIAQQLLLLPYHRTQPTPLPFRVTHLLLAGTRSVVLNSHGLRYTAPPPNRPRTVEERKATARKILQLAFDPAWVEMNGQRLEAIINRVMSGSPRSPSVIAQQGRALQNFDFENLHDQLPRDLQVMVIHGRLDKIIPFECTKETFRRFPRARLVEQGRGRGQIPSFNFGHQWFEYFDIQVWHDVMDVFLRKTSSSAMTPKRGAYTCD